MGFRGEGVSTEMRISRSFRGGTPLSVCFLVWYCLFVGWLTLQPFGGGPGAGRVVSGPPEGWADPVGNLLLFVPVGLGVAAVTTDSDRFRCLLLAVGVVGLFSGSVEAAQWFIRGRDVSAYDFLLNTVGGATAALLGQSVFRRFTGAETILRISCTVWVVLSVAAFLSAVREEGAGQLAEWNARFPVRLADEVGGDRPFEGEVREGTICAQERTGAEICVAPGADLEARKAVVEAALESQLVRAEATVLSESPHQSGPARILTFSDGPFVRNLTLGQREDHLVLRIRTPLTGENGTISQYLLKRAVPLGIPTSVEALYEKGKVRLTVASRQAEVSGFYMPGVLLSLTRQWPLPLVSLRDVDLRYLDRVAAATGIVLFLPLGLLAGAAFQSRPGRSLTLAVAFSVGGLALADTVLVGTPEPMHLLHASLGSGAGVVLLLLVRRYLHRKGESHNKKAG